MRKQRRANTLTHFSLSALALIMTFPFLFMLSTSLKGQSQIFDIPPSLIPNHPTFANYLEILTKDGFFRYFLNSLLVASLTTALTVVLSSALAFSFARGTFRFKELIYAFVLLGMMIPPVMLIIPQFLVAKNLGLLNSPLALILVYTCMNLPMQTFLLRGFFEDIPKELEEAAILDGASKSRVYFNVMLPLARPGIAVVAIFTFLYSWDEFPWANVAVNQDSQRTLPIALAFFQSQHLTQWGLVFAGAVLAVIPVLMIFGFFQRYFVAGVASTGMKG